MINLAEAKAEPLEKSPIGTCPICGDGLFRDYMGHIIAEHPDYQDVTEVEPLVALGRRITLLVADAERIGDWKSVDELLRMKDEVNKLRAGR